MVQIGSHRDIILSASIAQDFEINYSMKMEEFSTECATAYPATKKEESEGKEYYALILNKFFPPRLSEIDEYKKLDSTVLQKLVDFGKVQTTTGEGLCLIFEKPKGESLHNYIKKNGSIEEAYVINHIFKQVSSGLLIMHTANIMHGSINLKNIYIDVETERLTIRECFSEYIGFSQSAAYETYERMVCHPAGKSNLEFSADFYAAGITLVSLIVGVEAFSGIPNGLIKLIKYESGSYESVIAISRSLKDIVFAQKTDFLLKGIMHDSPVERWGAVKIESWQRRELSPPPISRIHRLATGGFQFDETEYYNPKYLAYAISSFWDDAKRKLNLIDLARWVSFTSNLPDIDKRLGMMTRQGQTEVIIPDEKIARLLYLVDPDGPVKYKGISFHPHGLGNLFSYCMHNDDIESLEKIEIIINQGFLEGWIALQERQELYKPSILGWQPRKIKNVYNNKGLGFGEERVLYELNPFLPCLSPLLEKSYTVGIKSLISSLNLSNMSDQNVDDDKHLMSYMCAQMEIEDSLTIKQLARFPYFNNSIPIKLCALFALAQNKSGVESLPEVASWIRKILQPALEQIHSKTIKKKIIKKLDDAVKSGKVNDIFSAFVDGKTIKKDVEGFATAKRHYKTVVIEILKLKSEHNMDVMAYRLGLRIAVIFAYLMSSLAVLTVLFINF